LARSTQQLGYCITENGIRMITCYGTFSTVPFTKYTMVHEFGHVFNNQSDRSVNGQPSDSLEERMGLNSAVIPILDCTGAKVMGEDADSPGQWERGDRGWGSGYTNSDFQQHDQEDPGKTTGEIDEAAGDMFLNWVYRKITDSNASSVSANPCASPATGTWTGFLNTSWFGSACHSTAGCPDYDGLSGNRRFAWMEDQISQIFSQHGW
jgi:hypothetical protein